MHKVLLKIKIKIVEVISKIVNYLYERICRLRLKNKKFSIICSNCIGGVIYHRLNMEFLSPTINLWLRQYDFVKMILNLDTYMKYDLKFIETSYSFPVALLGDIKIHFNHSKNKEEAKYEWNKRKSRILWDDIFIILYDRDNLTKEQILSLRNIRCKNLIVLSENCNYQDIDYVYHIKRTNKNRENEQVFLDKDIFGIRTFEKQWDFVKWLNKKEK